MRGIAEVRKDRSLLEVFNEAKKNSILSAVGNTPLVKLSKIAEFLNFPEGINIWGKLEGLNPGGSVKDRAALFMIGEGIASGKLTYDKVILDSTSGNTGIAYAMISAVLGIKVKLCIPGNASFERLKILSILGAELVLTNPLEGSDGAMLECQRIFEKNPDRYFKPDQYSNEANPRAHYYTTAVEIWRDTGGKVDFFVAGVGTGGTIMGAGKRLKELNPDVKIVSVEPEEPLHGLEGLRNTKYNFIPRIFDVNFPDIHIRVKTEDAYQMCKTLAYLEGLFVGPSSGAAIVACGIVAKNYIPDGSKPQREYNIVAILPDSGDRYFSSRVWEDKKFAELIAGLRWRRR